MAYHKLERYTVHRKYGILGQRVYQKDTSVWYRGNYELVASATISKAELDEIILQESRFRRWLIDDAVKNMKPGDLKSHTHQDSGLRCVDYPLGKRAGHICKVLDSGDGSSFFVVVFDERVVQNQDHIYEIQIKVRGSSDGKFLWITLEESITEEEYLKYQLERI